MAPIWCQDDNVVNLFAGVPRGTLAALDLNPFIRQRVRMVGTSGSSIAHMKTMRDLATRGDIAPNRSVAAICGIGGVAAGLAALACGSFAGKVVIFPQVPSFPLTPLERLDDVLPKVGALLADGRCTTAAEEEFLRQMLPTSSRST